MRSEVTRRTRPLLWPALLAASLAGGAGAHAETLAEALSLAYQSNPTLQQARAQQRALDETSVQARAAWRPTIGITASDDYEKVFGSNGGSVNSGGVAIGVTQPLYTSGRTDAAVRSADAGVESGRETLRATEAQVLLSVVQAYEDVLRDQRLLTIRQEDVAVLKRVLDEVTARRQVGQITRTDVLQIQTQLGGAQANLSAAQAQLQNSRASYAAVVGQNPGTLEPPSVLPQLPTSVDAAFDAAERDNPQLKAAKYGEESSRQKIAEARAGLGPQVALGAQYGYSGNSDPAQTIDYARALTAQVTLTQPLFAGGANASLIRQAVQQNEADRVGVEKIRRQVIEGVAQTWNQVISIEQSRTIDRAAVEAARLELEGMQEEYKVAVRTTLEVLSADLALRSAEVNLAVAEHDNFLAEATLLGYMGKLEAKYLTSGEPLYDPSDNFRKVKNRGATPLDPIVATLDSLSIGHVWGLPEVEAPKAPLQGVTVAIGAEPSPDAPLAAASPTRSAAEATKVEPLLPSNETPPQRGRRRLADSALKALSAPASDPPPAPPGPLVRSSIKVQIGSYPSQAMAEQSWRDVLALLPSDMATKTKRIEPATAGGTSVFRTLVLGFRSETTAERFCDMLRAKGRACLVRSGKAPRDV